MEPIIEQVNVERPRAVSRAVQFLASSLAIGLLNSIFVLLQRSSGVARVLVLLIVIAFFSVPFFLVLKASAGRNWARIIILILVIVNAPFAVMAYPEAVRRNVVSGTLSIIIVLLQWIGTYLLFTKTSNQWFRSRK